MPLKIWYAKTSAKGKLQNKIIMFKNIGCLHELLTFIYLETFELYTLTMLSAPCYLSVTFSISASLVKE